jgi:hypothetical protein
LPQQLAAGGIQWHKDCSVVVNCVHGMIISISVCGFKGHNLALSSPTRGDVHIHM